MRRFPLTREMFTPAGATRISDKASDAVAYLYLAAGDPAAALFIGEQAKPLWRFRFPNEGKREKRIADAFEARRKYLATKADQREKRNSRGRGVEVGHILVSSWGYDQTNIDWYEVTALIGAKMAEIRPIAAIDASKGTEPWMTGKCVPAAGQFTGEPRRVVIRDGSCKVGHNSASVWDGRPRGWSSYA